MILQSSYNVLKENSPTCIIWKAFFSNVFLLSSSIETFGFSNDLENLENLFFLFYWNIGLEDEVWIDISFSNSMIQ